MKGTRPSFILAVLDRLTEHLNSCEEAYQEQPEAPRRAIVAGVTERQDQARDLAKAIDLKETQVK